MAGFTPEAIPDVSEVRTGLRDGFERHRLPILGAVALAVVGSLALLAYSSVRREREDALAARYHAIVADFEGNARLYDFNGSDLVPDRAAAKSQAEKLLALRPDAKGSSVEPWILLQAAVRWQIAGEDDRALAALDELDRDFRDAPVRQIQSLVDERVSLVEHLRKICAERRDFEKQRKVVVPQPDLARSALVETDLGTLKIVFYPDLAPRHVEAFVAQAKSGGFNRTQFYLLRKGEWIEGGGGDKTRNAEPRDDRDDEPARALAPEDASRLHVKHRRRVVTSGWLPLSGDQEDRFAVVLAESWPEFDGVRTPFGELLDEATAGVADRIANAMTYSGDATKIGKREEKEFPNTPSRPLRIRRVSIWKEGVIEPGHSWDTARVNTDNEEPEPDAKKD